LFPAERRDVALPLIERGAVARTFDTPGFRGMTFYEVQAKSVVNRVPRRPGWRSAGPSTPTGAASMRVYCLQRSDAHLDGGRPHEADGRGPRRGRDLRHGPRRLLPPVRDHHRLAHWSTVKPAYRVILEDGTQLIGSGDHRFLTERGWKHVTGTEHRSAAAPAFLTVNNKLMGTGGFAEPPKDTAAYRRGYLCGMIRGDGTIGHYPCAGTQVTSSG
jgi:hypothetical protein